MNANASVFREYDIRGRAGLDLTPEFADRLGVAYAQFIAGRMPAAGRKVLTVSVGQDCRLSSPVLAAAVIEGLRNAGVNVIHLGNCPTPAAYFSLFHFDLDGTIMVTASHLPAEQNGFKICVGHDAIFGEDIQRIKKIFESVSDFAKVRRGTLTEQGIVPTYLEYLLQDTNPLKAKTVVLDCGNGNGSQIVPQLLRRLGAKVIELNSEMDGHFPNHVPDPSIPANVKQLIATVKECQADFGIGIDGDADRIGVVDETGRLLFGDELLVIFSRDVLKSKPGSTVVSEVKSSFRLFDDIAKHGGQPVMCRTGHSYVEAKMKETGAVLAGEMSGHMFFADRYLGYDDASYAAMRIYEIASRHDVKFSELMTGLKATFATPELRIASSDNDKFAVVERVSQRLRRDVRLTKEKFTLIDGVRIDFADGWGLIRASNTEPVLSLRFEALSEERLNEIRSIFETALEQEQNEN